MSDQGTTVTPERELPALQKIELVGKAIAVSLPITYVSGYLILTSFLGTFGIHLNASESFRAKYIYVGFEYLMFMALMVAIGRTCLRVAEVWRMMNRKTAQSEQEQFQGEMILALAVLKARNKTLSSTTWRRFQELRGDLVVGLIVLVFTLEIMFLNPENISTILPLHVLYLLAVAIYQATYYREVHEPFAWGLVYGRRYIEDIRWLLVNAQAFAVAALFLRVATNAWLLKAGSAFWTISALTLEWVLATAASEIEVLSIVSICASKRRLIEIERHPMFSSSFWDLGPDVKGDILSSFPDLRALVGSVEGYFLPCGEKNLRKFATRRGFLLVATFLAAVWLSWSHILSHPPFWMSILLVGAPLFLSLLVLANVGLLTALFSRRSLRLGYREESFEGLILQKDLVPDVAASDTQRQKWERYARRGVMATVLYVTSVLSFGYVVYPHVPVQKEGGNYVTANRVCVRLLKDSPFKQCAPALLPKLEIHEALVALEEDSDWVYLANDNDMGGPQCWSWAGMHREYCRPRVYAVSRSCIAGISDAISATEKQASCPSEESASVDPSTSLRSLR